MKDGPKLPVGLYDLVLTEEVREAVVDLGEQRLGADLMALDPQESHAFLADALADVIANALRGMPSDNRLVSQLDLCNAILTTISESATRYQVGVADRLLGERLLAILNLSDGLGDGEPVSKPGIPLSQSSLLVNAPKDHQIGAEVRSEVESADAIDLLCSFIKWSGYIRLRGALRRHCEKGRALRVLTTTYMGATEARALNELHDLGAQIRVSYDSRRTRLHAKAWYFHRHSGFDTSYIGSSNLSAAALTDGLEWNVRVSAKELPRIAAKFKATFHNYWNDGEFEPYDPAKDAERLRKSLKYSTGGYSGPISLFDIRPYPFQQEILDRLWAERREHDRWRNLVVAATGTGKTIMAALDYKRASKELGGKLSLLFVAHRKEILDQSLTTFRQVLRQTDFGELFVGGLRPRDGNHVFASVQSLAHVNLDDVPRERFDVVIVDEVHHASAPTYKRLIDHFEPGILLGLTATPERTDGSSIKPWFDNRYAAELRLWDAIDRGLLAPFQYFVLNDDVDLSQVKWARGRYAQSELENVYTGNDARVRLILSAVQDHIADVSQMRALGFCVGVEHARFMARCFNEAGIPAAALTGETDRETREASRRQLEAGHLKVLFTVDLFNEGVDIPDVDTVLFLRPTESAMLFLQQLGRGLRLSEGKECLTALDFVGHVNHKFRFDLRFKALTGASRRALPEQIEQGFPFLPSGCSIQLDRVAQELVLDNLRQTLSTRSTELVREIQSYGGDVDLATFLHDSELDLTDVYRSGRCWTDLKRAAGLDVPVATDAELPALRAVSRILHWNDQEFLNTCSHLSHSEPPIPLPAAPSERRRLGMILTSLYGQEAVPNLEEFAAVMCQHNGVRAELTELLPVLRDRISRQPTVDPALQLLGNPLKVHCTYSRDEIMAAHEVIKSGKLFLPREGIYFDKDSGHNLLFVTLQKSEKKFSPTTMYEDYAISPDSFHWQSQNNTRPGSTKGKRHVHHKSLGITPMLFIRDSQKDDRGATVPYLFLGPLEYRSHTGDRPMNIVWKLKYPMPMDAFRSARVVGG